MGIVIGRDPPTTPRPSLLGGSILHRLSSTLSKRLAKNDPTKQRTNFGWMKYGPDHIQQGDGQREEVPYPRRHERGSR